MINDIDIEWLDEFDKYDIFYKDKNYDINFTYIYTSRPTQQAKQQEQQTQQQSQALPAPEIYKIKKELIKLNNSNIISKEELVFNINKNKEDTKLISICLYNNKDDINNIKSNNIITNPNDLIKEIEDVNYIIHIGASSHVTRSVETPQIFMEDNIMGSFNLLEASRHLNNLELFYYFSTDEVFGPSLNNEKFKEWDRYNSKNPYSATKAAAEEITIAYANTYSLPILITHCSNAYGERQHYEKFK